MSKTSLITLFLLFLISTTTVHAQTVSFKKDGNTDFSYAQNIEVGNLPSYIFGRTARDGIVQDMYVFELDASLTDLTIDLLVPKQKAYAAYRPVFTLLEKGSFRGASNLPFLPPPGYSVQLEQKRGEWEDVVDALLQKTFYKGPSIIKSLNKGKYFLVVYDPGRSRGEYVVRIGSEKKLEIPWLLSHFISYIKAKFSLY